MNAKIIKIEEINKIMKEVGYYASLELQYNAFVGLLNFGNDQKNHGQDIFAVCLEGPPGAGKTEYAKIYTKLVKVLWNGEVELVDYQCDATTGKTELYEDIDISAAIKGDADNVNIPGKLIQAIKKVNEGKKIVLFIDEYDKAREETDAFLLQFLQSGKINSTQHGDLEIKEEYKSNLQLILCKNDTRENLSGPLSRRIRIIRLDYMAPDIFYAVAKRQLIEDKPALRQVDEGVLNLVSLIYNNAYNMRELFSRLPSCSEMLIAIQDADNLIKYANAPKNIVYKTIVENMFKNVDDIKTFESNLNNIKKNNDKPELKDLIFEMKQEHSDDEKEESLTDLIAKTVFQNETGKIQQKINEANDFIEEYKRKFSELESQRKETIQRELERINLGNESFVSDKIMPQAIGNFQDETAYIKRGKSVFGQGSENWVEIVNVLSSTLNESKFVSGLIDHAAEAEINVYEDGFLINKQGDFKLIMARDNDDKGNKRIRFFSNTIIVPANAVEDICNVIDYVIKNADNGQLSFEINCLIYNDKNIPGLEILENNDNIYKMYYSAAIDKDITESLNEIKKQILSSVEVTDIKKIINISKTVMKEESLVKYKKRGVNNEKY